MNNNSIAFRRIITGHNENGEAIFLEDQTCPNAHPIMGLPNFITTELWRTDQAPVNNSGDMNDLAASVLEVNPAKNGTVLRVVEFVPDSVLEKERGIKGPMLHRTPTLDYAYVIKGEVYAVLDNEEKLMKAGDVLIQRGTNHAWSNRSDETCAVLFVLIGAEEIEGLSSHELLKK